MAAGKGSQQGSGWPFSGTLVSATGCPLVPRNTFTLLQTGLGYAAGNLEKKKSCILGPERELSGLRTGLAFRRSQVQSPATQSPKYCQDQSPCTELKMSPEHHWVWS